MGSVVEFNVKKLSIMLVCLSPDNETRLPAVVSCKLGDDCIWPKKCIDIMHRYPIS